MPAALLRHLATAAIVALPLALGGCDTGPKYAPVCPKLTLLPDASDVATYSGAGRDLTDLLLQARITGAPAKCGPGDPGVVRATLRVSFDLTRGPANPAREVDLPYFLAISEGGKILEEQDFHLRAVFPANIDQLRADSDEVTLAIPVTPTRTAAAYTVYVGFRLTPDQLRQNRSERPPS